MQLLQYILANITRNLEASKNNLHNMLRETTIYRKYNLIIII